MHGANINGAESLVRTFIDAGVDTCFANPGTSEMHFVAALDRGAGMKCVLGLFEGVVTGAADGYARMADKPAVTLLHLGPGLGNGFANLHNARKAQTPIVNVVGEHATYHIEHDAPLTTDIEGIARTVSPWVRTSKSSEDLAADGAAALAAAQTHPGQIATLILPANTAWGAAGGPAPVPAVPDIPVVDGNRVDRIAEVLKRGEPTAILIAGKVQRERPLSVLSQICAVTGAHMWGQTSNARLQRGAGRPALRCVPFVVDLAVERLKDYRHIILVGAKAPVAFFAYPGKPSTLWPEGCEIHTLTDAHENGVQALDDLAEAVGALKTDPVLQPLAARDLPRDGPLSPDVVTQVFAHLLPENAIVIDEAITANRTMAPITTTAQPHDWLQIVGGSIGDGIPLAVGAATACRDRKVVALQADGSGMYTLQGLWTQAREGLDITTIIFSNRAYAILKAELKNVGVDRPGQSALDMLGLDRPDLDWVSLARGHGVEAGRAESVSDLSRELQAGLASGGPYLIEAVV